ncbi:hypothetical protein HW555_010963 [Spodoptera exigua]|uniref:Odorant receptor n=1 Tax=Spodoptera exigua TaxID=7107 RepID=A0A835L541_SPOEX|nr:hypothetical protein HW555_010963 [Spodoptera exigua]
MGLIKNLCLKLSYTKAIDRSSGKLETIFFENYYRIAYVAGMSTADDDIGYLVYSNVAKLMIVLLVLGVVWYGFMETTSFDEFAANLNVSILQFITFIFPLVDDIEYNLIVGVYLPFFYKSPSMYPLAYMLSVLFFIYISHFVMVTDLKMQTHLIHLLCQFAVLGDCFENMIPDCMTGFEGTHQHKSPVEFPDGLNSGVLPTYRTVHYNSVPVLLYITLSTSVYV